MSDAKFLEDTNEWYRERVVWGFYEDRIPKFYQGKAGEAEICEPVSAEEVNNYINKIEDLERACKEWAETSQHNYQCAKVYYEALESIAQPQYGLQSIMEDCPDPDSKEYLEAALKYYQSLVYRFQNKARESLKDPVIHVESFAQAIIDEIIAMRGPTDIPRTERSIVYDDACDRCIEIIKEHMEKHAKA